MFNSVPDDSSYTTVGWLRVTISGQDYFIPAWQP
jgi:hypothetical protein